VPPSPRQKLKLLLLKRLLEEQSDPSHPLSMAQLIEALAREGVRAERKSVYSDIALLRDFGLDIEMTHDGSGWGYHLASRDFELAELKLLVDAVQGSRFITPKKSRELIGKLAGLTSAHLAGQLERQVVTPERPKSLNESIYYNIDDIHNAIGSGRQISFRYFDYDLGKERSYRRQGARYTMTPLALVWDDDKYYLVCYNAKYDDFTNFRVDRMSATRLSEEPAEALDPARFNLAEYIDQRFGMYSGPVVRARLGFDRELVNVVLDRFGARVDLTVTDGGFEIWADVSESPVFLGWMAQFGDKAEVLAPESLRDSMRELAAALARRHGAEG